MLDATPIIKLSKESVSSSNTTQANRGTVFVLFTTTHTNEIELELTHRTCPFFKPLAKNENCNFMQLHETGDDEQWNPDEGGVR